MHVGVREDHLLQEDDVPEAVIELAGELLVARCKPAAGLHLEEQAEKALVEIDHPLLDFGQGFGM
jgi:hypothetical protein